MRGCRVWGLGFREGLGFSFGFRVYRVQGLGFSGLWGSRVYGYCIEAEVMITLTATIITIVSAPSQKTAPLNTRTTPTLALLNTSSDRDQPHNFKSILHPQPPQNLNLTAARSSSRAPTKQPTKKFLFRMQMLKQDSIRPARTRLRQILRL